MIAISRTAAPPIATPAIPPVLSLSELDAAAAGGLEDPVAALLLIVAVIVAKLVTVVGLLLVIPFAVRLL